MQEREREESTVNHDLNFISSAVEAAFAQAAYEFPEDASDEAVCVVLSNAAERSVTVLLNTANQTAVGKCSFNYMYTWTLKSMSLYFQHQSSRLVDY